MIDFANPYNKAEFFLEIKGEESEMHCAWMWHFNFYLKFLYKAELQRCCSSALSFITFFVTLENLV